jgi:hypothetical protein
MLLAASAVMTDRLDAVAGGWTWQSATFAAVEGSAAAGFSLWALAWFRHRWNQQGPLTRWASRPCRPRRTTSSRLPAREGSGRAGAR